MVVYLQLATKYSVDFFARKSGVKPPEIKTIDEALDYATKNMKAYARGGCAFQYGAMKAESVLQGAQGSLTRLVLKTAASRLLVTSGIIKALGKRIIYGKLCRNTSHEVSRWEA